MAWTHTWPTVTAAVESAKSTSGRYGPYVIVRCKTRGSYTRQQYHGEPPRATYGGRFICLVERDGTVRR